MKITARQLRQIIREEVSRTLLREQNVEKYKITFTTADGKAGEIPCRVKDNKFKGTDELESFYGESGDFLEDGQFGGKLPGGPFKVPIKNIKLVKCQ